MANEIAALREAVVRAAGGVGKDGSSPLGGFCAAVACLVQGCLGGDIMEGAFEGEPHYWNRLPDGREVDLTSCQFGGDGVSPVTSGTPVARPGLIDPLFIAFAVRVQAALRA